MTTMAERASLLALDWGTSSLRAYVLDAEGQKLAERHEPWGLMQVSSVTGCQGAEAFNAAFDMILSDWPDLPTSVSVIAAGMVGSAQGWKEVPYLDVPCGLDQLAKQLVPVQSTSGRMVWIVPGLREAGTLPNVMRGEETQIVGALAQLDANNASKTLLGLPGSHSKWAIVQGEKLVHFDTFMTGEAFSALGNHTILARTSSVSVPEAEDIDIARNAAQDTNASFERGVVTALSPASKGVLATIFSCRTLGLSGELSPRQQREYLSGLLIGAEIAGMRDVLHGGAGNGEGARAAAEVGADASTDASTGTGTDTGKRQPKIALVGDPKLCERYTSALRLAGIGTVTPVPVIEDAAQQGLWQLARMAGLLA